jgi:hypothetical protein
VLGLGNTAMNNMESGNTKDLIMSEDVKNYNMINRSLRKRYCAKYIGNTDKEHPSQPRGS